MAEVAGLTFAVLGGADLCLKYGRAIVDKYRTYSEADKTLGSVILRLQFQWSTLDLSLETLRGVETSINEKLQCQFSTLFQHLQVKLREATILLDSVVGQKETESKRITFEKVLLKKGNIHKVRFVFRLKKSIEGLLEELEQWQYRVQPLWYLLALIPNSIIDQQLATDSKPSESGPVSTLKGLRDAINRRTTASSKVLLPESTISRRENKETQILYCLAEIMQETGTGDSVLVESFYPLENSIPEELTKNVNDFACVLSAIDPSTFGILACQGIIKFFHPSSKRIQRFQFVFSIPGHLQLYTPRSLREILIDVPSYPLEERFRLATRLARSVVFVHTAQFVHKNIRPETIIVFQSRTESTDTGRIGVPFLMGFDNFRPADGHTFLAGDSDWKTNLYRHPTRQGMYPEVAYRMQHDIYSLGVCLLEIGLWGSFVLPDPDGSGDDGGFKPGPNLKISQHLRETSTRRKAQMIKAELVKMAKTELPNKTGSRYTNVVVLCLSCLDNRDNYFGQEQEFLDEDGVLVGVQYIEKVLEAMGDLCV